MNRKLRRCGVTAACVLTIPLLINPGLTFAQEEAETGLEEWEQNELRPLLDRLNAAVEGELPPENPAEITVDFLKGSEGSIYVPFTMKIDPSVFTQSQFILYMFVTPHTEPVSADADAPESAEDTLPQATYEDLFFVDMSEGDTFDEMLEIRRAFQAPGGNYDVYIIVRDSAGEQAFESAVEARQQAARLAASANRVDPQRGEELQVEELADSMVMLHKEEVEVPNFWNEELQTSSIIMARTLDQIETQLAPEEQRINPYTIGTTQIVPKLDRNYTKSDNLSLLFYVYNPQLTAEMNPDVTVEFNFYRVGPVGESFFNKTPPQEFNAQTWPAGVPVTGGLPSGQSVPLGGFPAGDFRLEVQITDNAAEQMLTRNVLFNVSE